MKKNNFLINMIITVIIWLSVFIIKWQYDVGNIGISLKIVTYLGLSVNIYCIVMCYIIENKFTNPYILFQAFSIPFLYGQLICREILNYNVNEIFDLKVLVTDENIIQACFLIMFCQLALHIGVLITKIKNTNTFNYNNYKEEEQQLKTLKTLGIVLIAISIIPTLYDFYLNLMTALKVGYAGRAENNTYGLESMFSKIIPFFKIGMLSLMVGCKNNKSSSKFILFFIIIFYGVQMFFGNRGIPLITLITSIWLYHMAVKKINKKIIIIALILVIPATSILNVIRQVRGSYGVSEWISRIDELIIEDIQSSNPILEVFYELGVAIYPTSYTLGAIPEKIEYKYGKLYLLSAFSVVAVNANNEKSSLAYDMNIAAQITKVAGSSFGGSYIQEAYANFGWYCPVFMIFLGIGLELLHKKIYNSGKLITVVLIAYLLNPILWTVRNVIITLPREIVWYVLPTYIIYNLIYNKGKKAMRGRNNV